jgi:putative membrane protein
MLFGRSLKPKNKQVTINFYQLILNLLAKDKNNDWIFSNNTSDAIGLVNSGIRPVLSLLSLPLNFVTLGSFSLVVNGVCFWLASILVPGFSMSGLLAFILAPVTLSFASTFLNQYFSERGVGQMLPGKENTTLKVEGDKT